ncbi:flagellar hook-length control protein FliK [Pantoea phytobeneficialis]|uniref:Flagellar hook-length control protein FliK n=1 Tax=Pantoea phytobeneficialis TaxID=2052056 RepID=A0AAP9H777_9GAMM|nr:flagellar hook-length control protein FliK [Pantoea phytobeneficialis]MDO6408857.1 flagellar hook-length control protein FliK [Pantoea phytobeneficialis]QGR07968.1 flagellar hook-length control protein FliK [Pantoea phytobeneficialis]
MITLPTLVTQTASSGEADTSASTDILQGVENLPQDFVTALGNQLLTLAKQQGTNAQSADSSAESDEKSSKGVSLSALLEALDKPETLNALLQPENIKATLKSADDKDKTEASSLSASDLQNVQALFAMLPAAVEDRTTQTAATTALSENTSDSRASLNSTLLSALTSKVKDEQSDTTTATTTAATKKSSDVADALTAQTTTTQATSTTAGSSSTNSTALTLDESFQQVLSTLSKPDDKRDLSSSDTTTPVTSAPLSSTSTLTSSTASTSTTPSTPMLNAQLGSSEWQQALSQQIVMFSRNGQQNAELRLHPEDLGAIQISLTLDKDQAQLNMVSSHSHVRAALEAALPQLKTALAESGINLGQSNVSSDASAQGQNYQGQQEGRRDGQHGSFTLSQDSDNEITPIAVPAALQARATGNGAVDIFA